MKKCNKEKGATVRVTVPKEGIHLRADEFPTVIQEVSSNIMTS